MENRAAPPPRPLTIAWAATLAGLIAATWRLWMPVRSTPLLPPIEALGATPERLLASALGGLALGLLVAMFGPGRWRGRGIALTLLALAAVMAVDQLRWQPWAWHALLAGAILANAPPREATALLRLVAVAVYAYSGLAKLDAEFAATLGQQFLSTMALPLDALSESTRTALALAGPCLELALACLLLIASWRGRWRRGALIGVVLFHVGTIVALSPIGLGHSLGVLLWNVGFAAQTALLFRPTAPPSERPASQWRRVRRIAWLAAGLAILAPALTPFGWWDRWPGWALYAPGGERATLLIHDAAVERLPDSLQSHVGASDSPWRPVALDAWILQETGAPLYPQNRVFKALTRWLAGRYPLTGRIQVIEQSAADRWTRDRTERTIKIGGGRW